MPVALLSDIVIISVIVIITLMIYIANHLRWKSFTVAELNYNLLENIHGWMAVLHGKAYYTGYFTGKVSWLLTDDT